MTTAWELARAWPESELHIVERVAHSIGDDAISSEIVAAAGKFLHFLKK